MCKNVITPPYQFPNFRYHEVLVRIFAIENPESDDGTGVECSLSDADFLSLTVNIGWRFFSSLYINPTSTIRFALSAALSFDVMLFSLSSLRCSPFFFLSLLPLDPG